MEFVENVKLALKEGLSDGPQKKSLTRPPLQGRSRASYERMMEAAEQLLSQGESADFTLSDVAKLAKVAVGTIYGRFENKEAIVYAVQERALERIEERQKALVEAALAETDSLRALVSRFVDEIADLLREHGVILRPLMHRAATDHVVAATGKQSFMRSAALTYAALLSRRSEIGHEDPEHAVEAGYAMFYAMIARYLGFGSSLEVAGEGDWSRLKQDIATMWVAFLKAD